MTDITSNAIDELHDLHSFLAIIQHLNVGVIVVDRKFTVRIWNSFMETNSGINGSHINGHSLYKFFPEVEHSWLKDKKAFK